MTTPLIASKSFYLPIVYDPTKQNKTISVTTKNILKIYSEELERLAKLSTEKVVHLKLDELFDFSNQESWVLYFKALDFILENPLAEIAYFLITKWCKQDPSKSLILLNYLLQKTDRNQDALFSHFIFILNELEDEQLKNSEIIKNLSQAYIYLRLEYSDFPGENIDNISKMKDQLKKSDLEAYKDLLFEEIKICIQMELTGDAEKTLKRLLLCPLSEEETIKATLHFKQFVENKKDAAQHKKFLKEIGWNSISETYAFSLIRTNNLVGFISFINCMPPIHPKFWERVIHEVTQSHHKNIQKSFLDYLAEKASSVLIHKEVHTSSLITCIFEHMHVQSLSAFFLVDPEIQDPVMFLQQSLKLFTVTPHFKPQQELLSKIHEKLECIQTQQQTQWEVHKFTLIFAYLNLCVNFRDFSSFSKAFDYLEELLKSGLSKIHHHPFLSLHDNLLKTLKSAGPKHLNKSLIGEMSISMFKYFGFLHENWTGKRIDYMPICDVLNHIYTLSLRSGLQSESLIYMAGKLLFFEEQRTPITISKTRNTKKLEISPFREHTPLIEAILKRLMSSNCSENLFIANTCLSDRHLQLASPQNYVQLRIDCFNTLCAFLKRTDRFKEMLEILNSFDYFLGTCQESLKKLSDPSIKQLWENILVCSLLIPKEWNLKSNTRPFNGFWIFFVKHVQGANFYEKMAFKIRCIRECFSNFHICKSEQDVLHTQLFLTFDLHLLNDAPKDCPYVKKAFLDVVFSIPPNHPMLKEAHLNRVKNCLKKIFDQNILRKNDPEYVVINTYLNLDIEDLSASHLDYFVTQFSLSKNNIKVKQRLLYILHRKQQNLNFSHLYKLMTALFNVPLEIMDPLEFITIAKFIIHLKKSASPTKAHRKSFLQFSQLFLEKAGIHTLERSNCFSFLCIWQKLIKTYIRWGFYAKKSSVLLNLLKKTITICERLQLKPIECSSALLVYFLFMSKNSSTPLPPKFFEQLDEILNKEAIKVLETTLDENRRFLISIFKKICEREGFKSLLPKLFESLSKIKMNENFSVLFSGQLESISAIIKKDLSDLLLSEINVGFHLFQIYPFKFSNPIPHNIFKPILD